MKVVEKFTSINGEGTRAGELAVFIRFKGCNQSDPDKWVCKKDDENAAARDRTRQAVSRGL